MYTDVSLYRATGGAGQGGSDVSGVYSMSVMKAGVKKARKAAYPGIHQHTVHPQAPPNNIPYHYEGSS